MRSSIIPRTGDARPDAGEAQASLEAALKDEILRMHQEVAENPDADFHFHHGRETAARAAGPDGRMIGVDLNPAMGEKATTHLAESGETLECHAGRMEDVPLPDASVDVVISNGVINLSSRKRRVIEEMYRVLNPGGRVSITDIVSGKQPSQTIVNDPKLWAS